MTDAILLFECARADDVALAVALPPAWAREHDTVEVVFERREPFGWQAALESVDGDPVLAFPWYDHVDRMLSGDMPSELPDALPPDGAWDDLEQGWWGAVRALAGEVFVAETVFEELVDVRGNPPPRLLRPGLVDVGGVEVTWSRVPRAAWDRAWEAARARSTAGR